MHRLPTDTNDRFPAASGGREPSLRETLEGMLPDLAPCARLLGGGSERAATVLERALARAVATWRGPVGPELCAYAVSWFVYLLYADAPAHRHAEECDGDTVLFSALPPVDQIALVLGGFDELPPAGIAAVAGRAFAEFELELCEGVARPGGELRVRYRPRPHRPDPHVAATAPARRGGVAPNGRGPRTFGAGAA